MHRLLVIAVLCLSLVWADGEEKAMGDEEKKPQFTTPPRPAGDVYFTEDFQDPEAVWSRFVSMTDHMITCACHVIYLPLSPSLPSPFRKFNDPYRWVKSSAKKDDAEEGVALYDGKEQSVRLMQLNRIGRYYTLVDFSERLRVR